MLELAIKYTIATLQRDILASELLEADEVWITSSTREIVPVIKIDAHTVKDGKSGPLWQRIIEYYQDYKQQLTTPQSIRILKFL